MRILHISFLVFITILTFPSLVSAYTQYVIVNFATINELAWDAPQAVWDSQIKPQVLAQIREMKQALQPPSVSPSRMLGWSTLMEYMNFPLDNPSANSPYAIKMRRIMELAEEENLPVFIPLNGFQWWDQLPELYNWWDDDGTHTDPAFFARQKNPTEFKARFIAGFDPENIWNVQWRSWGTPMKLNYRNWGGGGFRLAPPPALTNHARSTLTYRTIQKERLKVILSQVLPFLEKWKAENRENLFAGLSLGTEISLNASVTPEDEFIPYGYRDLQDLLCPQTEPRCGSTLELSPKTKQAALAQSVNDYLVDLTRLSTTLGIPKQKVYTHVWSEAVEGEPRYANYAKASLTLYSRPGMSFYGFATDPLSHPDWSRTITASGSPAWGAMEYSAGQSQSDWQKGLRATFDSQTPASIMVIYNWQEHKNTGAIPALATFLTKSPQATCNLEEILTIGKSGLQNPIQFTWQFDHSDSSEPGKSLVFHVKSGASVRSNSQEVYVQTLSSDQESVSVPKLKNGIYTWYVESSGCKNKSEFSTPQSFVVLHLPDPPHLPGWVNYLFDHQPKLTKKILTIF